MSMRFGLQIGRFNWPGAPAETATRLAEIAGAAEAAGFSSLSVMDHFVQIPSVGREWEDMLESTATLGYLAASTSTIRLGALVTGITYRNLAHVAKIVATLDVLSRRPRLLRSRRRVVRPRARAVRLGRSRPPAGATTCSRTPSSCCR